MQEHQTVYRDIESLHVPATHSRKHSPKQINKLARSISSSGVFTSVVINPEGTVYAGAARIAAAKKLGLKKIPTMVVDHLTEAQLRAYALADNRIAEDSEWDDGLLRIELQYLMECVDEVDIDDIGFETAELDTLLNIDAIENAAEEPPIPTDVPVTTQPGDIWLLDDHRVMCGDSTSEQTLRELMGGAEACLQISDPPYNVRTKGHISIKDEAGHGDFAMAAGEMTPVEFTDFLTKAFTAAMQASSDGSLHYLFMDWRHIPEMTSAIQATFGEIFHLCVWAKTNGGMGSFYRSQHELVFVAKKGDAAHVNNIQLGANGRYRTNVWRYPGMNSFSDNRAEVLAAHPTVKPTRMIVDAILDASPLKGVVLDSFLGSGTTLLAAEQTGRICRGMELNPSYVDVAVRRWELMTGREAIHAQTAKTFTEQSVSSPTTIEEALT